MDIGKLGVWYFTDGLPSSRAAEVAQQIESLGFGALWIPETVGRNPFAHASWLLANTQDLVVATGIANIYHREPGVTLAAQHTLAEQSDNRFLLGIGVSHKPLVEGLRGLNYGPPVKTMREYLAKMKASPYGAPKSSEEPKTVIAALGPKMLELAASAADGAHPYFSSPVHTQMAREVMGQDAWLCVEQKVIFETDPSVARQAATRAAKTYQALPNYRNNWLRMGLTEEDINSLSDRFIDETFAWGDVTAIRKRIQEHYDAGATHVCIQPIRVGEDIREPDWRILEELAN